MNREARRRALRSAVPPEGVVLAYAHPGEVSGLFHDSVLGMLLHDRVRGDRILLHGGWATIVSGPRISAARTQLVDAFLHHPSKAPWLLMLDTDMVFEPDLLDRLLEHAHPETAPIVGGLTFAGQYNAQIKPQLYVLNGDGMKMDRINDYPRDALCKVDATGAACLLIHRSALTRLEAAFPRPYPWFCESVIDGIEYGEDLTFCLRARQLGIPVHVHTGIHVGHVKPMVLNEPAFDAYRERVRAEAEAGAEPEPEPESLAEAVG